MRRAAIVLLLLFALPAIADEPLALEDVNVFAESGWNRDDAVLQYNTFFLRNTAAFELTQEWAAAARHQFGFTVPVFNDGVTGLGDAMVHYRYQLVGGADSRVAVAPRFSLVLPTRSARFGERSSGVEMNVPLSVTLSPRVASHSNVIATWFRDLEAHEVTLAQGLAVDLTPTLSLSFEAAYKRTSDGQELFVARPALQFTMEGPGGLQVSPGVGLPLGSRAQGLLFFVAIEHPLD